MLPVAAPNWAGVVPISNGASTISYEYGVDFSECSESWAAGGTGTGVDIV
jgi:hypothetical protein